MNERESHGPGMSDEEMTKLVRSRLPDKSMPPELAQRLLHQVMNAAKEELGPDLANLDEATLDAEFREIINREAKSMGLGEMFGSMWSGVRWLFSGWKKKSE